MWRRGFNSTVKEYVFFYRRFLIHLLEICLNSTNTMAVANLNLPTFPTFDLTEKDTLKTRWNKYLTRFKTLCKAIGVTVDGQKHSMLLTYFGDEM